METTKSFFFHNILILGLQKIYLPLAVKFSNQLFCLLLFPRPVFIHLLSSDVTKSPSRKPCQKDVPKSNLYRLFHENSKLSLGDITGDPALPSKASLQGIPQAEAQPRDSRGTAEVPVQPTSSSGGSEAVSREVPSAASLTHSLAGNRGRLDPGCKRVDSGEENFLLRCRQTGLRGPTGLLSRSSVASQVSVKYVLGGESSLGGLEFCSVCEGLEAGL